MELVTPLRANYGASYAAPCLLWSSLHRFVLAMELVTPLRATMELVTPLRANYGPTI